MTSVLLVCLVNALASYIANCISEKFHVLWGFIKTTKALTGNDSGKIIDGWTNGVTTNGWTGGEMTDRWIDGKLSYKVLLTIHYTLPL